MTTAVPQSSMRFRVLSGWLFRFSNLVLASAVVALAALAWVLWPAAASNLPRPLPIIPGEAEIVWLAPASDAAGWERFVTAVELAARNCPDLVPEISDDPFPREAASCPQMAVSFKDKPGRLLFRWYRLTGDWNIKSWVDALLTPSRPAPLAIIGGENSERAGTLARALEEVTQRLAESSRPLLCITTATADHATDPATGQKGRPLTEIYPGRTYRFCFTNRQMAEAVIGFIWSRDELRPDTEPVYMVYWDDDPYSRDLTGPEGGFREALVAPASRSGSLAAARDVSWLAGSAAAGAPMLNLDSLSASRFRLGVPTTAPVIDSGVGGFDRANSFEAETAQHILKERAHNLGQLRPLLLLSAQQAPSRRFLRAMARTAPTDSQRFVVGTGDSIGFNTIYRDRNITWPVQDLPFPLVIFSHRNPVDRAAGFDPKAGRDGSGAQATSTDQLLLNRDIIETLVQAAWAEDRFVENADELGAAMRQAVWLPGGRVRIEAAAPAATSRSPRLFDDAGNREKGTGEHVVWLMPETRGDQVLPRARITVWPLPRDWSPGQQWPGEPSDVLTAPYDGEEGGTRAGQ